MTNSAQWPGTTLPHRLFACLLALPQRYCEAIADYDQRNPSTPFVAQAGLTYDIRRLILPPNAASNMTIQDVIHVLIDNRISPSWIDHGYTYGLNYLNYNFDNSTYRELFDTIDNERITRVRAYGIPPAIAEWDGWRPLSCVEVARLHTILDGEK